VIKFDTVNHLGEGKVFRESTITHRAPEGQTRTGKIAHSFTHSLHEYYYSVISLTSF